jgi:hypothetical protein
MRPKIGSKIRCISKIIWFRPDTFFDYRNKIGKVIQTYKSELGQFCFFVEFNKDSSVWLNNDDIVLLDENIKCRK